MSAGYHIYTIAFAIPSWLTQDIAAHVEGLPVKPQHSDRLHLTAITVYGDAERTINAALQDRLSAVEVTLGRTNIHRQRSLAIDLLEFGQFREFQEELVDRLRKSSRDLMSPRDAKCFMDGLTQNRSLTTNPHITIANVFDYDIPAVPLSDTFMGKEAIFDRIYLETDYKKNQRRYLQLTTARASPAPQGRRYS